MTKDLQEGDGAWQFPYPPPEQTVPLGEGRLYHEEARDMAIITFGNGVPMSLRAAKTLREAHGLSARVLDLRWLSPLNTELIARHAGECGKALVVDEGRRSGGVGEGVIAAIVEKCGRDVKIGRVVGEDTYIPLGPAANLVLPQDADIVAAARKLGK
jgi:2-oxoisovalerate dehydrogenase E1 component